jgi:uncharacterized protein YgbK (DUF1537 family)
MPESADGAAAARLAGDVRAALQAGRPCAVAVEPGAGEDKPALVTLVGEALIAAMEEAPPALVLNGGETAFRVLVSTQATGVQLGGEWRPGVPYGKVIGGPWQGLPVVTKAGGLGSEETLLDLIAALQSG